MKTNRAMLGKRKKGKLSFVSSKNEHWVDPKQPTFEQLMEIRTRIRKQEKTRRTKTMLMIAVVLIAILIGVFYIINL
jgi:hypothetical protein